MTFHINKYFRLLIVLICVFVFLRDSYSYDNLVTERKLKNGITLMHKYIDTQPLVTIWVCFKVGAKDDPIDKAGLTYLTVNTLAKGTSNGSAKKIFFDIDSLGGYFSSGCNMDYSSISMMLPSDKYEKGADIMSDIMLNPVFSNYEYLKEREMAFMESVSNNEHNDKYAYSLLLSTIYPKEHPYSHFAIGTEQTLENITREDLINWYKKYFGASSIFIVVVGKVPLKKALKVANKNFGGIKAGEIMVTKAEISSLNTKKDLQFRNKFKQASMILGWPIPKTNTKDMLCMDFIRCYLSTYKLMEELREKLGLCYMADSVYVSGVLSGIFFVYTELNESKLRTAKAKITDIIEELKTKEIEPQRFNDTKKYLKGNALIFSQTNNEIAGIIGYSKMFNIENMRQEADEITSTDVMETAKKYFTDNNVSIQILPEK